jgi:hypothetical protein
MLKHEGCLARHVCCEIDWRRKRIKCSIQRGALHVKSNLNRTSTNTAMDARAAVLDYLTAPSTMHA